MKKGRKAERGIQRERGKNEKEIKRKGDREKGTRRKRQGKKREKETLPKALRTQALTALTSNFGLVGLVGRG